MPSRLRNVVRRYLPAAHAAHGCVAVVLCSVLVAACGKTDPALDNDAYVWQRRWTPAVTAAMTDSADLVRAWRVLAADVAPDGKWSDATPALPALAAAGRPAIMVLRFDGRGPVCATPRSMRASRPCAIRGNGPASRWRA